MSLRELKYVPFEILDAYLYSLYKRPVITKSVTSAFMGGLGDVIYQLSQMNRGSQKAINYRSISTFACCGLLVTGPMNHHFFKLLDKLVPNTSRFAPIKRLLIDRFIFAPVYLLILLYVRCLLEGMTRKAAKKRILRTYLPILKMSYRVWTIAQYINLNHIPQPYRVLFMNVVSLGWNVYLAIVKKDTARK